MAHRGSTPGGRFPRALSENTIVQMGFDALLEILPIGIAMLDANGAIVRMNALAQSIIATYDEKVGESNHEIPPTQVPATILPVALAQKIDESNGHRRVVLDRLNGRSKTYLTILPLDLRKTWTGQHSSGKILLLCDLEFDIEVDDSVFSILYGLTPTEARLAARVITGERIDEAARDLGISESTARTHLKRIFKKTNVSRQAELVLKLLLSTLHSIKIRPRDA